MPTAAARSASSSTIAADLPPSSRKTFFRVGAAAAMIARPVAVEPVNETRSTRGSVASTEATPLSRGVTTLSTPGGRSVCSVASRPSSAATHGVSGAGLSTTVLPASERGTDLGEVDLVGEVPRRDRGDDADGLAPDRAPASGCPSARRHRGRSPTRSPRPGRPSSAGPRPARRTADRRSGTPAPRPRPWSARASPRRGRPAPGAAGAGSAPGARGPSTSRSRRTPARGGDGGVHVVGRGVGGDADLLAGGRVEDRVRRPVARLDELAVDQQRRGSRSVIAHHRGPDRRGQVASRGVVTRLRRPVQAPSGRAAAAAPCPEPAIARKVCAVEPRSNQSRCQPIRRVPSRRDQPEPRAADAEDLVLLAGRSSSMPGALLPEPDDHARSTRPSRSRRSRSASRRARPSRCRARSFRISSRPTAMKCSSGVYIHPYVASSA